MKDRIVHVTRVYEANAAAEEGVVVNIGGSRSSKSYSIAQLMVRKYVNERDKSFLTTRKSFPSLRVTAYRVAVDMMKDYGYYPYLEHNRSYHEIYNPKRNNSWFFTSIDNPEKIKSTEYNYIHMEEANEFTYDDYMILKLRMSGKMKPGERNQMFISLNPSDMHGWVNQELMKEKGLRVIHSTYKDALPFLPPEYVKMLERLEQEDDTYWTIYGLGEFAEIKEKIYPSLIELDTFPDVKETIYGLDFGFNNPMALLEIGINEFDLYERTLIYETRLTTRDLIDKMKELRIKKTADIYADPSDPAAIEEIAREGYNIRAAEKFGQAGNWVKTGIDLVRRFKRYTLNGDENNIRENNRYKWKKDRAGNVLEEPVKFDDHLRDAERYSISTHLRKLFIKEEAGEVYYRGMSTPVAKREVPEDDDEYGDVFHE